MWVVEFDALVAFSTEKWKQANSRRLWTVDAEADIIKSQKQPLLLTPWTNLSSAGYAFRCIVVLNGPPALHVSGNQSSLHPTPSTPSSVLRNPPVPPLSRITVPELRHCSGLFGDLWILLPPTNFHGPLLPTVCCDWRPLPPHPVCRKIYQMSSSGTSWLSSGVWNFENGSDIEKCVMYF